MEKLVNYVKAHKTGFAFFGLLVVCYFLYFYNVGNYPLIDVDETRYVSIARDMLNAHDWMTLKLNNEFFFEKPPLYFWILNSFFTLFGQISETIARLPIAIIATITVLSVFGVGSRIVSRTFGFVSALIMATSFEFIVLSRIAILDIFLSSFIILSVLSGFMTFFTAENKKKYYWWAFYIFSALAILAKGIPGFILPFGTMFFAYLVSGKIKEIFKPQYFLTGVALFFLITIPWHINMLQTHGHLFFHEYIIKHHLARFVGSEELGREEAWYFYIFVFAVGFLPWIFTFVSMIIEKIKTFVLDSKSYFSVGKYSEIKTKWESLFDVTKFLVLNVIAFLFAFLFFSSASTKLPTYILPVYAFAAYLLGYFWTQYIYFSSSKKSITISTIILNSIFLIAAVGGLFTPLFLKPDVASGINTFRIPAIILFTVVPVLAISGALLKRRWVVFSMHIALMVGIVIISANSVFNYMCSFGENDLIEYALKARSEKAKLATFDFGRRYSLNYYYEGFVDYHTEDDIQWLKDYSHNNPDAYIVVKIKNMDSLDNKFEYKTISIGKKYCLIKKK
ncbi:MAG: glycosyltransferase family 39 protein [Candidatus Gastranaerophilales bacterium]|nr:glycosyltransferase family 39 protein [Candidatus Gastranaerophilales bacterium]